MSNTLPTDVVILRQNNYTFVRKITLVPSAVVEYQYSCSGEEAYNW